MTDHEALKVAVRVALSKEMLRQHEQAMAHWRSVLARLGDAEEIERIRHERRTVAEGDRLLDLSKRAIFDRPFMAQVWAGMDTPPEAFDARREGA